MSGAPWTARQGCARAASPRRRRDQGLHGRRRLVGADLATETQFTLDEVRAIVDEAGRVNRKVTAHAPGRGRHPARTRRRRRLDRAGPSLAKWDRQLESFRMAVERGVPIALGTNVSSGEVTPSGMNGHEFALMTRFGLAPWEALRAGTVWAAEPIGVDGAGRLGPGSLAEGGRAMTTDGARVAALN